MSVRQGSFGGYRTYLLILLLVLQAFNFTDRLALGIMLQDIKRDLALSDTQLGFLTGIAFALFYSIMGIPLARWADRGNRVVVIATTAGLWSVGVVLCGYAHTYTQLLLIRVVVAIGEAGCVPPAHSLIADYFSRAERPRAVGIYMLGGPLGVLIGYLIAGKLNLLVGWRYTFIILGVPGIFLGLLAWYTLGEPRLKAVAPVPAGGAADDIPFALALKQLWRIPTYRRLVIYNSIASFFGAGLLQWQPTFFVRSFGLDTAFLGFCLAIVMGGGGLLGTYLGGRFATSYAPNDEPLQLRVMAFMYAGFGILYALAYLSTNYIVALAFAGLALTGGATANGPLFAIIQGLVPSRMRAVSVAVIYLAANLVGLGFGPLAVGVLSDTLRPLLGEESLRYALVAFCPGYFLAAWFLWRASRDVLRDILHEESDTVL